MEQKAESGEQKLLIVWGMIKKWDKKKDGDPNLLFSTGLPEELAREEWGLTNSHMGLYKQTQNTSKSLATHPGDCNTGLMDIIFLTLSYMSRPQAGFNHS
jgi:hypothetical protein